MEYLKKFRELRDKHGWKQQEVADFLGVARATYTMYETGKRKIDIETFVKLCNLYHVTPNEMLGYNRD